MVPLPKLLSIRQAAALTGLSKYQLWYALSKGHISSNHCQKVDTQWVLTEDFKIKRHGILNDPVLSMLPDEIVAEPLEKDFSVELPERPNTYNLHPTGHKRRLRLPGYVRETEGMTGNEVRRLTGVQYPTQNRIKAGYPVRAKVALRLAKGLGIPVERLMK